MEAMDTTEPGILNKEEKGEAVPSTSSEWKQCSTSSSRSSNKRCGERAENSHFPGPHKIVGEFGSCSCRWGQETELVEKN